jgi:hypothetical protein
MGAEQTLAGPAGRNLPLRAVDLSRSRGRSQRAQERGGWGKSRLALRHWLCGGTHPSPPLASGRGSAAGLRSCV